MESPRSKRNVRIQTGLHPMVYAALAGCVLWIVAAAWFFFAGERYGAMQIAVVAGFAAAFLLTPLGLWKLSGARPIGDSFRDWLDGEIELADGSLEARHALIMIMLAPVSGAAGITVVSLVAYLAAAGLI